MMSIGLRSSNCVKRDNRSVSGPRWRRGLTRTRRRWLAWTRCWWLPRTRRGRWLRLNPIIQRIFRLVRHLANRRVDALRRFWRAVIRTIDLQFRPRLQRLRFLRRLHWALQTSILAYGPSAAALVTAAFPFLLLWGRFPKVSTPSFQLPLRHLVFANLSLPINTQPIAGANAFALAPLQVKGRPVQQYRLHSTLRLS